MIFFSFISYFIHSNYKVKQDFSGYLQYHYHCSHAYGLLGKIIKHLRCWTKFVFLFQYTKNINHNIFFQQLSSLKYFNINLGQHCR